jgi:hypothetical protein
MMNEYEQQANNFLNKHGLLLHAQLVPFAPPSWLGENGVCGDKYRVSLIRKNGQGVFEFDYWSSYNDAQKQDRPTEYDILTCLSSDAYLPDSVDEMLREFGGNDRKQAQAAVTHAKALRKFLSEQELQDIGEIR